MAIVPQRKNPFGDITTPTPTFPSAPGGGSVYNPDPIGIASPEEDYDVGARMRQLYTPEMEAQEMFGDLMTQYPQRENPSMIRSIGASLAGLGPGGYEVAHKAAYQPFYDKLEDWKNRIEPAQAAMGNERLANVNLRTLANQIVSQEMADKRLERAINRDKVLEAQGGARIEETARRNQELEAQGRVRNNIAMMRARGGKPQLDPSTGQWSMLFSDGSTLPIPFNQLAEEDKMQLQQDYDLEKIRTGATERAETRPSRTVQSYRVNEQGVQETGVLDLDTNIFTPATVKGTNEIVRPDRPRAAEEAREITARALAVKNANPRWAKYIEFDNAGRFRRIKPPSLGGLLGPNKEMFAQIFYAIYGRTATPAERGESAINPATTPTPTTPTKSGQVRVVSPDGRTGSWDLSAGPIPPGFKEIK